MEIIFNNYYDGNKMIKEIKKLYDLLKTVILTSSGCGGSVVVTVVKCCDAKTDKVIVPQTHRSIGSSYLPVFYSQMRWLLDKHVRERRTRAHIHTQDIHTHNPILAIFH